MRSNCVIFAVLLYLRLRRRWARNLDRGLLTPVPRLVFRGSFIRGGPFHLLVGRGRRDGTLRVVSYKPPTHRKPYWGNAGLFRGHVVWGDPPWPPRLDARHDL
jgi:hypothetical protein